MIKKIINIDKKVTSNKTKHIEADKKPTDITKEIAQISEKRYDFLLARTYFTRNDGHKSFLGFTSMLSSLILDSNRKANN